ncbi:helix-turn-helix domain-containing protein [Alicyclobacillus sacchari]|uniref:helix-turn-helix domain-containing protein n=1 Tax=Alicyclobacillus sacchari TaxID=392010 RepID=UPI001416F889
MYLTTNQNATETAKALYIHRNTLLYRIKQIEQLLDVRLRDISQVSTIWAAFECLSLLQIQQTHPS